MADENCNLDAQVTNMEMTEHIIISNQKGTLTVGSLLSTSVTLPVTF